DRAQLEEVVHLREEIGRATNAHRREPRERFVARRFDADAPLDVRAQAGDVLVGETRRGHGHAAAREVLSIDSAAGSARRCARAMTRSATASAAPGRPKLRAAA